MTSKFLNLSTDGTLAGNSDNTAVSEKAIKTYADNKVLCYGVSTTAAATVQKEVSIPSVTNLAVGTVIIIQPTITSTVANSTIKLNDFDAYPMRYNNAAITTSTDSVVWNVAYPSMWVFDGTYWVFIAHGVDSNSTYDMSYLNATGTFKAGGESGDTQVLTRYCLAMQRPDRTWEKLTGLNEAYSTGTAKTVNTHGFLLPADIRYYNTTTIIAAGGFAASQTLRPFNGAIDMRYSTNCGNTPGWTNGEEFFLVGTIGSDGLFYLDSSTWWSNALPTSNDGKVYIQVGVVHGTYNVTLALRHPIYYHDGTQIREYQVADNKQDVITDLSTIRSNASSGAAAATTIAGYGDIVTHNASEFALDSNAVHKTDIMVGATSSSAGTAGLVPAPAVADKDKFLKGDGTWGSAGSGSVSIDNKSITQNGSSQIQTVGVIDQNNTSTAVKTWSGTRAQYDAIATKDANTYYNITDDVPTLSTLLEALYPVGSIYISTNATCPLSTLISGSSWVQVASGKVLQGSNLDHPAGTTIEAGLPNITGTQPHIAWKSSYVGVDGTGAFQASSATGETNGANTGDATNTAYLGFDASLSNPIYGNSDTVQPAAYVVNIFRRTA